MSVLFLFLPLLKGLHAPKRKEAVPPRAEEALRGPAMTEEAGKGGLVTRSGFAGFALWCSKVVLSPCIHIIQGYHGKQCQMVTAGSCRPVLSREISPACDLHHLRTESIFCVEEEDLLTSFCLSRIYGTKLQLTFKITVIYLLGPSPIFSILPTWSIHNPFLSNMLAKSWLRMRPLSIWSLCSFRSWPGVHEKNAWILCRNLLH